MKSAEEMEQAAKRWEVASVSKAVETQGKQLDNIELKVDKLLDGQVTHQSVDEKLKTLKESIHGRYDPIADNVKWVTRALILAVIGLITNVVIQIWSK